MENSWNCMVKKKREGEDKRGINKSYPGGQDAYLQLDKAPQRNDL